MSQEKPALTDLMVRYPFVHYSRRFFDSVPIDESLASRDVQKQAESRLMNSLGRQSYEPHLSEHIEFSSFFIAALVASQDSSLASRFARKEGERSKGFFMKESQRGKSLVIRECFGLEVGQLGDKEKRYRYSVTFEDYLSLTSRYELTKLQKWKLVRQPLWNGIIYFTDNMLNDFFGDCAQKAVADGVRNLRRAAFPRQLLEIRNRVLTYVPAPKTRPGRSYVYIEELLKHPISDGRHRLVWLVLAPYLVNVKKLDDEEAIERIRAYVSVSGEMPAMRRFVEYNVKRARRNGLMPPTIGKLRGEHPDLYSLLPKEVLAL
ncbi:MAG: DNA primase noncatalytic subunit PriX [Thaumarchaeota archaeon]|nr:DNA primase noncatalytic subunit PriX [Nitrososphaerota archaeon]